MTPPLISSDSHVSLPHDVIKTHLATKYHDPYDTALMQAMREMLGGNAAKANMAGLTHVHQGSTSIEELVRRPNLDDLS